MGQTCFVVTRFGVTSSRVESRLIIPVAYKEGHEPGDHFAGRILPAWIKNKNTTFNDTYPYSPFNDDIHLFSNFLSNEYSIL